MPNYIDVSTQLAEAISPNPESYTFGGSTAFSFRFNAETVWTSAVLTNGTAAHVAGIINTAYGSVVATSVNGQLVLTAPLINNTLSAVYINNDSISTANTILGFVVTGTIINPYNLVATQAFVYSSLAETYAIVASTNDRFIFKFNEDIDWITATLTAGAARTAQQICTDINLAFRAVNPIILPIAQAVIPVVGDSPAIKIIAPNYNSRQSRIYIKSTRNSALTILGFTGDDTSPITQSSILPISSSTQVFNPITAETVITFGAGGTQYYYLTNSDTCAKLEFIRVAPAAGSVFTCYIDNLTNIPPFTLGTGETFSMVSSWDALTRIIIVATGIGSLVVRELNS